MTPGPRQVGVVAVGLLMVVATGCGSSPTASDAGVSSGPVATATTIGTEKQATRRFEPVQEHAWTLEVDPDEVPLADTGERVYDAVIRVEIALGDLVQASTPPPGFEGGLAGGCDVDSAHDAYLPLQVTLRNDSSFAAAPTIRFGVHDLLFNRSGGRGDSIEVKAATLFKPYDLQCDALNGQFEERATSVRFASVPAGQTDYQRYLLLLPNFFSPNFDSEGNRYRLRRLVGYIDGLEIQVAGDEAGNSVGLARVTCYRGTDHQGVEGEGTTSVDNPVLPAFALVDGDFAYRPGPEHESAYYSERPELDPASDFGSGC